VNQRLKLAQLGVAIERRGSKLSLRGTFPPHPESDRLKPYQQRLSLNLPAPLEGLKQAEQQAKIIAGQLLQNTFSWQDYLPITSGKRLSQMALSEKIDAFHQAFLDKPRRGRRVSARTTWKASYAPYLRKLEITIAASPHISLSEAILITLKSIPESSRGRQIGCTALNNFADFLGLSLPFDIKDIWGSYNSSAPQSRQRPTDQDILDAYALIPNPAWRFVYGIMATYGLRNHEVFLCDYSALSDMQREPVIEVSDSTKTGPHFVLPFYRDWMDNFDLRQVRLPKVNTDLSQTRLQRIGQRVSAQFRRYDLPFSPYDLRHAWAVRTIHAGIPDTVAARMMGHSVAIHTRTHHRWISRRDQQRAVDTARQHTVSSP
jgi:hypothetical protein